MKYVVGYTADRGGKLALDLASNLAYSTRDSADPVELDLVMVVRHESPFTVAGPGADPQGFEQILDTTLRQWADDALATIPAGVTGRVLIRAADSEAEGILAAADEVDARMIVVAPRSHGLGGSLGSVANALMHSSPVPVMLAVANSTPEEPTAPGPSRVTAFVGTKAGADAVAHVAAVTAQYHHLPLRIVSLLELDQARGQDAAQIAEARELIEDIAGRATLSSEVVVAPGRNLDEAIAGIEWRKHEIAMLGSSRLGGRTLFLGSTAHKVLRATPVPVVVVPRAPRAVPHASSGSETDPESRTGAGSDSGSARPTAGGQA